MSGASDERVFEILARVSGRDRATIKPEQDLAADLDVGSAQALELLATLEEELSVEISEVEAARLRSVRDVLEFVRAARPA
ncbi:MAG: acyl carrier protein [Planctomycetes bacterium]|nr:acyl carrier protein [Planctomycetota bacterium]MCW8138670.1 acyl carrier protein [Planctomycetota bacterium]